MMHNLKLKLLVVAGLGALLGATGAWADDMAAQQTHAQASVGAFTKADPGMSKLFQSAAAYAVFPEVKKGAFIVGGAGGEGVLYEHGKATGKVTMTQMSVGAQVGGQTYTEVIFLENQQAVNDFKAGKLKLSAQTSAVAAKQGASANAKYQNGVQIFTTGEGGLMVEASVGGQAFKYEPYTAKAPGT